MNKQWTRLHELADEIGITETLNILERTRGTSGSTLADRWSPAQKELAHKVSNDIAEDIDCKESRAQLRQCVAVYADLYFDLFTQRESTTSEEMLRELKKICERAEPAKTDNPDKTSKREVEKLDRLIKRLKSKATREWRSIWSMYAHHSRTKEESKIVSETQLRINGYTEALRDIEKGMRKN